MLLSHLLPYLSREEAPLRRRLFCSCNFLQRRPVPSCPAHSGHQLRQAGWGERPQPRFGDAAEGPAGTTARKSTCTPKHRDTHSMGVSCGLTSSAARGGFLWTHLVALHPQLVPGCATGARKDKSCSRVKSPCAQLLLPHTERGAGSRTTAAPQGKEPGGSCAGRAAHHRLVLPGCVTHVHGHVHTQTYIPPLSLLADLLWQPSKVVLRPEPAISAWPHAPCSVPGCCPGKHRPTPASHRQC